MLMMLITDVAMVIDWTTLFCYRIFSTLLSRYWRRMSLLKFSVNMS